MRLITALFCLTLIAFGCDIPKEIQDGRTSAEFEVWDTTKMSSWKTIQFQRKTTGYVLENVRVSDMRSLFESQAELIWCEFQHSFVASLCGDTGQSILNVVGFHSEFGDICFNSISARNIKFQSCSFSEDSLVIDNPLIESITLVDCGIRLLTLGNLPRLKRLDLSYNDSLEDIIGLNPKAMENLRFLNVAGTALDAKGFIDLPVLEHLVTDSSLYMKDGSYRSFKEGVEIEFVLPSMPRW